MPHVKYIANGNKTDSIVGIGLDWAPGQVRNVTADVAARLLVYSDTWITENRKDDDTDEPIGLAAKDKVAEEPLPVIDFHNMDKAALLAFAETNYNEKFDKRNSETNLRHKVIALFTQREMDKDSGDA